MGPQLGQTLPLPLKTKFNIIMKINVSPISIYTSSGPQTATKFEVRHVTYRPLAGAVADTHLLKTVTTTNEENGPVSYDVEVGSGATVEIPQSVCDTWTDDTDFAAEIARIVGLTPESQ
jgi:hypothetical protein